MEVNKANFQALLPAIKEAIDEADFISVDCELTGLNTGSEINAFDTQKQYYEKVVRSSKDFLVIQYGLCIFKYNRIKKLFKQRAYNFYIFPRPVNKYLPDHRFLCQASSIDFLISQGFDFNKLFKDGISYLNMPEENKYKESLLEKQKIRASQMNSSPQNDSLNPIPVPDEDKPFIDDVMEQMKEFVQSDHDEVVLPKCNAFLRRLIYQQAHDVLKGKASLETRLADNKDRVLVVTKFASLEDKKERERLKVEEEQREFENCLGFTKVIRHVINSGKIIVGHNMCLDLLHTINKFVTPLPDDYEEFKDCAHCLFSKIVDTKYMSSVAPFKELIVSNVLGHLLKTVTESPFTIPSIEVDAGAQGYSLRDEKEHEAGYDAFITGVCFLAMWSYLGKLEEIEDDKIFTNSMMLRPYLNRLFLMRLQDAPFIQLGGKDPQPSRDHVFYVAFPKDWKSNDIIKLFSPFGNIFVAWIDERSAYVGLYKRDQAAIACSTLSQSDIYTVMPYAKRQCQLAGTKTIVASPLPSIRRKRSLDELHNSSKKRRTSSLENKFLTRSFDPIVEDPEEVQQLQEKTDIVGKHFEVATTSHKFKAHKASVNKTFQEDGNWD